MGRSSRLTVASIAIRVIVCVLPSIVWLSNPRPYLGPVSRKSRELFGPEKPFIKLRPAYSVKLGPVPERKDNSIPGINVPYSRDNFIPGINSVPERRNSAIQGINLG